MELKCSGAQLFQDFRARRERGTGFGAKRNPITRRSAVAAITTVSDAFMASLARTTAR
jgi:hypothetical protein